MSGQTVEKCVLILGKCRAGKTAIANQIAGYDPVSNEDLPYKQNVKDAVSHAVKLFTRENVQYKVTVIDIVGLFDTKTLGHNDLFDKIGQYFKSSHIKGVNVILFVFRQGRMTDEERKVFSLAESRFAMEISPFSALAFTGCENMDDEARKALLVREFEG